MYHINRRKNPVDLYCQGKEETVISTKQQKRTVSHE